jgi:hypothetical protein
MEIFGKKITVSAVKIIILLVLISIIILSVAFSKTDNDTNPKSFNIFSGLLTGLIVGLFQLLLSWYEHRKIQKLEEMKIIDVMTNRDDRVFYEKLIRDAKKELSVMGVTASRFIEHFADIKSDRENCKVLISAMARGVNVKILLPKPEHLNGSEKQDAENKVKSALLEIKGLNNSHFDFKYFDHVPAHSIFIIDDKCILGPVFPDVSSKDTPAIYLKKNSPFAEKYLNYFNSEWSNAK